MKVYLDDLRPCPDGWVLVRTAPDAIALLAAGCVTHISLDHDLGDDDVAGTGYDVVVWVEEAVATRAFTPPEIALHTANAVGRQRMAAAVESIERLVARRGEPSDSEGNLANDPSAAPAPRLNPRRYLVEYDAPVIGALLDLGGAASVVDVRWMLVGGQALIAHGVPRDSPGVDAIVTRDGIGSLAQALVHTFAWLPVVRGEGAVQRDVHEERQMMPLRTPFGMHVELRAAQHPIEEEMLGLSESHSHSGVSVPLPPLGGVLLLKMIAGRLIDIAAIEQTAEHLPKAQLDEALEWAEKRDPTAAEALSSVVHTARARRAPVRVEPAGRRS